MKSLLERQIRKYLTWLTAEEFKKLEWFLLAVDEAYDYSESDRRLMEHSLDISSKELMWINEALRNNAEEKQKILDTLVESINSLEKLRNQDTHFQQIDMKNLSSYLKKLIDESIENQQKISSSERYLSTIVDSIWEGICVVDENMNIQLINQTAVSMLGLSLSKWQWKRYDDVLNFYQISTMNRYKDFIKECLEWVSKVDIIFDDIGVKTPNNLIPVSVVVSAFRQQGSAKDGCIIVFRDKTKEKEIEDMKNEFISIASHELRTPMTVINGFSEMLLEEKLWPLNENQKRYLSRIQTNTIQLINMVNDMLTLSKLESSKMDIQLWEFDIAEVINEVATEVWVIAKDKNITLSVEVQSAIVFSDKSKIGQVLVNLIANACKFTPRDGSIKVVQTISLTDCTISIQDTGIGIKESDIPKLFSKFYQAQQHLQSRQQGTGLGLSICKLILSHLQGKIWVKSEVGKGSEFSFSIPLKYVEEKQEIK